MSIIMELRAMDQMNFGTFRHSSKSYQLIIYRYTGYDDLIVQPLAPPPQTHTSDRPIFKIPFDSENLEKFRNKAMTSNLLQCINQPKISTVTE